MEASLQKQKVELLKRQAELLDVIQKINKQLKTNPVTKENKDWIHRAADAKRYRVKELNEVQIELNQLNAKLQNLQNKRAEAFFRVAQDVLPDDLFGKIMQIATDNFAQGHKNAD